MASITYDFTQADTAAIGWSPGAGSALHVVSNQLSTTISGTQDGIRLHGLSLASEEFQLDLDLDAPLNVGEGGVYIWLMSAIGNGYGFFCGNAAHIQRITSGVQTNLTNVGRPGEGGGGHLANHVTLTRTSTGDMEILLDAVSWGTINDTTHLTSGCTYMYLGMRSTNSPTFETTVDNVVLSDTIGGGGPPPTPPLVQRPRSLSFLGLR